MSVSPVEPVASGSSTKARAARACSSCNRQKLRCDGGTPCTRCVSLGHECEYLPSLRGKTRKRKGGSEDHSRSRRDETESLESQLETWRRHDTFRDHGPRYSALWGEMGPPRLPSEHTGSPRDGLDELTTLPLPGDAHNPLAVLAEASATAGSPEVTKAPKVEAGVYYKPLERHVMTDEAPHIMKFIRVHEAEQLFKMYFLHLHPHLPLLDKEHSSPSAVARRNNFLFNAICCVAARAFNVLLWERLKEFARFEMERLPKDKNIEVVQGHLIYAMWNLIRPSSFERDMSWLRVGVAVRTAIDINLHRVALVKQARDGLPTWLLRSIIRTWLLSYIIDRTLSEQLGKPSSMRGETSVRPYMRLITEGEKPSTDDVWVAALAEWTQILARAMDVFRSEVADSTINQNSFPDLVHVFQQQFRQWRETSEASASECGEFMIGNIRLYYHYAKLVVLSFGLQRAVECIPTDIPTALREYRTVAIRLINGFEVDFETPGLTRGCPDFVFTVLTYAAVSLLKVTQAQFAHLEPDRATIFLVTRKAADMLARAAMASDHLPASQSVFLSRLIEIKSSEAAQTTFMPEPMDFDFEAFGNSLDQDQSQTLWPPSVVEAANAPTDLNSWVAQQGYSVPGAALGLGAGSFLQDQDSLFTQDSFWKSVLEGTQAPAGGLV